MTKTAQTPRRIWLLRGYAALLALIGLTLLIMGGQLVILGGSVYYALAGFMVIAAALLLWRGDSRGGLVYAAMLVGTVCWAFYEVGLDGWALVPRLIAPTVLGLPLLAWLIVARCRRGRRDTIITLGITAILVAGSIGGMMAAAERIESAPSSQSASIAAALATDWPHVGLTQTASRYSPLTQITPQNAAHLKQAWSTYIKQAGNGLTKVKFQGTPIKVDDTL
ncbi:MAG: membrane-bound PQQ-dependent dehydrogenase, glucose/quinate/shikimate family, partial [Alphaproteobacteria bacterium]|nr:membrane-bound PQQ-dependent dehydrogenase, glucose/quinate/shikimate family [Alphaproteobacteria bacterium]